MHDSPSMMIMPSRILDQNGRRRETRETKRRRRGDEEESHNSHHQRNAVFRSRRRCRATTHLNNDYDYDHDDGNSYTYIRSFSHSIIIRYSHFSGHVFKSAVDVLLLRPPPLPSRFLLHRRIARMPSPYILLSEMETSFFFVITRG